MQPVLEVRQASLADADQLARLRWVSSAEDGADAGESQLVFAAAFRAFIAAAFDSGAWTVWVVADGTRLRGTVYVQAIPKVPRPDARARAYGYVTAVYLEPAIRNQGVGSWLLDAAIDGARTRGLESLVVWPSERSVAFYARRGFLPSGDAMELTLQP